MSAPRSKPHSTPPERLDPAQLDQWFPSDCQQQYINQLRGNHGLTQRNAECFVRLWGYCLIKQFTQQVGSPPTKPLDQLEPLQGSVVCTQREAAELFYGDRERGSDRAAGLMINQLVAKKLVRKEFDGNLTHISISPPANFSTDGEDPLAIALTLDDFNPRTDAVPIASILAQNYSWLHSKGSASSYKIIRGLRKWAEQYPQGMRVLRRRDSGQAIGFYSLFPTDSSSEEKFSQPPSDSLYLFSSETQDPIRLASLGDPSCYAVFIRSWHIDPAYRQSASLVQFLQDTQQRLGAMRQDFPNLCDLYAPSINPEAEALCKALGFQSTTHDPKLSLSWLYLALDHFLDNDDLASSIAPLFG
ncbi:MAG: hypothetical protein HC824_10805 [Synechococcales cyanobacterium RM1_1_8]|nr:hypothetical protein [Synechococcales cyanobacterium RM1_1_8]